MRLFALILSLAALVACEVTPSYVEKSDIDDALAFGRVKTVCVGLAMKEADIREYAAKKLNEVDDPDALECVCEYAYDAEAHEVDLAILEGLKSSKRDDLVGCFLTAAGDKQVEDRAELLRGLNKTQVPAVKARLLEIGADTSEPAEIRAVALSGLGGYQEQGAVNTLIGLLSGDDSDEVRAAAATALVGQKDEAITPALVKAAEEDSSATVRAAALESARQKGGEAVDALICEAMIKDEAPEVRRQAVRAYKGTKRDEAVACLREKAFTEEPDGGVRSELLAVLKSFPNDDAPKVLCDAIPFFMKTYIKDEGPDKVAGTDIAKIQNDRDWDNSYACFQRALAKRGGWSCKGRQYVAHWFREVGGSTHVPRCAGDPGAGEVVFQ